MLIQVHCTSMIAHQESSAVGSTPREEIASDRDGKVAKNVDVLRMEPPDVTEMLGAAAKPAPGRNRDKTPAASPVCKGELPRISQLRSLPSEGKEGAAKEELEQGVEPTFGPETGSEPASSTPASEPGIFSPGCVGVPITKLGSRKALAPGSTVFVFNSAVC